MKRVWKIGKSQEGEESRENGTFFVDLLVIIVSWDGKFSVSSSAKEKTGSRSEKKLFFFKKIKLRNNSKQFELKSDLVFSEQVDTFFFCLTFHPYLTLWYLLVSFHFFHSRVFNHYIHPPSDKCANKFYPQCNLCYCDY